MAPAHSEGRTGEGHDRYGKERPRNAGTQEPSSMMTHPTNCIFGSKLFSSLEKIPALNPCFSASIGIALSWFCV